MKFEQLKKSLNENILPAYIIGGEDSFLLYKSLELIENACAITLPDFNKVVFNKEGFNAKDIITACEVLPIMDDKRLVVVKDYLNAKNEGEKKIVLDYLKNPSKTTCLVFWGAGQNAFYLSMLGQIEYIDCNKLSLPLLVRLAGSMASKAGYKMDAASCNKLIEYCNYNMTKIEVELQKLFAFTEDTKIITSQSIEEIVSKDEEYVIFELTDALSKKDGNKAFLILDNLLYKKNPPTAILAIITNHFRRMFYSSISEYSNSKLASLLGVKEFAIIKAKEQAVKFTKMELKRNYELCLECEYNIKSGKMEGKNAISFLLGSIIKG